MIIYPASVGADKRHPTYRLADGTFAVLFGRREALIDSSYPAFGEGTSWQAEGYRYREMAPLSEDHHFITAGGVRLRVEPDEQGRYPIGAFPGNFSEALELAVAAGPVLLESGVTYEADTGAVFRDTAVQIFGNGARIRRTADADIAPILDIGFSLGPPVSVTEVGLSSLWAGYPVARLSGGDNFTEGQTVAMVGRQYRFVTSPAAANDVRIGADRTESLANLAAAINGGDGAGTAYSDQTVPSDQLQATVDGAELDVTSLAQIMPDEAWQFATDAGSWTRQNAPTEGGRLTLAAADFTALSLRVGDVLKVVSDDLIPWSDPEDGEYCGECVRVDGVTGGVDILTSQPPAMWQHFQTNVRLAKMTDLPVRIEDLELVDTEGFAPEINASHILLTGAVQPELHNIGTRFGAASHLEMLSCYKPRSRGVYGSNLRTSTAERYNAFGYVIVEYGCTGGLHTDLYGSKCRHVYTTGAREVSSVPGDDLLLYGGVVGAVVQGIGADCEHYAFDTHSDALRCHFDVTVSQGYSGMLASLFGAQLRGEGHTLKADIEAQACVTCKVVGAGTGGHDIDVVYRRPDLGQGLQTDLVRFVSSSSQAARARLRMRAVIGDYGAPVVRASGVDLAVSRLDLEYAPQSDYTAAAFYVENCEIGCAALDWDMRGSTVELPRLVRQLGAGGKVVIDRARVRNAPEFYAGDLGGEASASILIHELLTDSPVRVLNQSAGWDVFANRVAGAIGQANVRTAGSGLTPPAMMHYSSFAGGGKTISWLGRHEPQLCLMLSNGYGADVDLTQLSPPAHDGQRLCLSTISAGAGYRLLTTTTHVITAEDVLIGPARTVELIGHDGLWRLI